MMHLRRIVGRARQFVIARLDPTVAVGLRLTLLLFVVAGSIWAFSGLLDAVLDNATLVRLDLAADALIQRHVTREGVAFFAAVTNLGAPRTISVVAVFGGIALWISRHHATLLTWTAAFGGWIILEQILKYFVHRTRPPHAVVHLSSPSYSFPSGHAMAIVVGVGMLLYVGRRLSRPPRWVRIACVVAGAALVLLIGVSRVYLGVHYPSDVLGGYTAAAAWVAGCISASTIIRHKRKLP